MCNNQVFIDRELQVLLSPNLKRNKASPSKNIISQNNFRLLEQQRRANGFYIICDKLPGHRYEFDWVLDFSSNRHPNEKINAMTSNRIFRVNDCIVPKVTKNYTQWKHERCLGHQFWLLGKFMGCLRWLSLTQIQI